MFIGGAPIYHWKATNNKSIFLDSEFYTQQI